jgi:prolyl-tRNA editing enzyme YbaK/EbsC (Cys-tRNA(Pro) deacylase)
LLTWLEDHNIRFQVHEHPLSFTAEATAHADGVDARAFAKVVGLRDATGNRFLVVVDATDQVDLVRLAAFLGVDWVTVLAESEMSALLPACDAGTIPPIPELAQLPVYADEAVRADEEITFHAGSHRHTVRVERRGWEQAAGIRYGSFARLRGQR